MSTPAMVMSAMLRLMIISVGVFWAMSFVFARVYVFYEAYTEFHLLLRNQAWLRRQCVHPEFYSNLHGYAKVCDDVIRNAERNAFLIALDAVANTANLCGRYTCTESLAGVGWPVLAAGAVTVLFVPTVLWRVVHGMVVGGLPRYSDDERHLKHI